MTSLPWIVTGLSCVVSSLLILEIARLNRELQKYVNDKMHAVSFLGDLLAVPPERVQAVIKAHKARQVPEETN